MKNTLEYLLAIANYDAPELQRSIFGERANVDFAYLLDNRYLVENGRFGSSVFEMGELVHVFRNQYDGKFYYKDCGTPEEADAERLVLFAVDFTHNEPYGRNEPYEPYGKKYTKQQKMPSEARRCLETL